MTEEGKAWVGIMDDIYKRKFPHVTTEAEASVLLTERFQFYAQAEATEFPGAVGSVNIKVRREADVCDRLLYTLTAWMLDAHKEVRRDMTKVVFPASPWDFFKQEWFPAWALERWPAKYNATEVPFAEHHHHICPHLVVDGRDKHITFMYEGVNGKKSE